MKRIFLLAVIVLSACGKRDRIPSNVYSKDIMTEMILEKEYQQSMIESMPITSDSADFLYRHYENKLFEDKGIDREKYYRSFRYYMEELNGMEEIYAAVIDSLSLRQRIAQEGQQRKNQKEQEQEQEQEQEGNEG